MTSETIERVLFDVAGNGCCDEETGDVSETGCWYGLIRGKSHCFIISQDEQGFKSWDCYTPEQGEQAWRAIEDEMVEAYGPQDGDFILSDDEGGIFYEGKRLPYHRGKDEDRDDFIRRVMDAEKYWPNAWWISDHGNAHRIEL